MKVRELIDQLHKLPPDAVVKTDGCDCYGDCGGAVLDEDDGEVMIYRTDGCFLRYNKLVDEPVQAGGEDGR